MQAENRGAKQIIALLQKQLGDSDGLSTQDIYDDIMVKLTTLSQNGQQQLFNKLLGASNLVKKHFIYNAIGDADPISWNNGHFFDADYEDDF